MTSQESKVGQIGLRPELITVPLQNIYGNRKKYRVVRVIFKTKNLTSIIFPDWKQVNKVNTYKHRYQN